MIYLDNSASTKPRKEVIDTLLQTMEENYANADAIHSFSHNILLKIKNEALYFCFELESVVWLIVITSSPQFHLS